MYGKIFRQMYKGSLASVGPWEALVTFQQFIVLADRDGIVDMTADAISRETTIPLSIIQRGIAVLELPDPESRTPDADGKRIERLSTTRTWGWKIVNYEHYRKLQSEEDRTDYHRRYWREKRSKNSTGLNNTQQDSTNSIHAEVEAVSNKQEAVSKKKVPTEPVLLELGTDPIEPGPVEKVFAHWQKVHQHPRAHLDRKRRKLIVEHLRTFSEADLCQAISGYLNSPHHMGQNDRNTVYDDIELLLRDSKHIEAGLKFYADPPRTDLSTMTRRNVAAVENWLPPEMRTQNAAK